jgi:hypothetical protein
MYGQPPPIYGQPPMYGQPQYQPAPYYQQPPAPVVIDLTKK